MANRTHPRCALFLRGVVRCSVWGNAVAISVAGT